MTSATGSATRGRRQWVRHGLSNRRIYWGIATGCALLPLPGLYLISAIGNTIAINLMRKTMADVTGNFRVALGLDERTARARARALFYQYGLTTVDLFRTRVGGPSRIPFLAAHPRDDRIVRGVCREGRGCLVVTGHLGNWELGGIYLAAHGFEVTLVGQPELDPEIQALRDEIRSRFGLGWIEIGSSAATALRVRNAVDAGRLVCLLVDRPYPEDHIEVELFERSTRFLRSPALLARFCRCPVVPSYLLRNRDGSYRSYFGDPLTYDPEAPSDSEDRRLLGRIADTLERGIREEPNQWYNFFDYWGNSGAAG